MSHRSMKLMLMFTLCQFSRQQTSPTSSNPPHGCAHYGLCKSNPDPSVTTYTCPAGDCFCQQGWTGPTCSDVYDACTSTSCMNGGTCTSVDGVAQCACTAGLTGPSCEFTTSSPCASGPCKNGATCTEDGSGGYYCTCTAGYGLPDCAYPDACTGMTCQNGATCATILEGQYGVCVCPSEFTGSDCSVRRVQYQPNTQDLNGCYDYDPQLEDSSLYKKVTSSSMTVTMCQNAMENDITDTYTDFVVMGENCYYSTQPYPAGTSYLTNSTECSQSCPGSMFQKCGQSTGDQRVLWYTDDTITTDPDNCASNPCGTNGYCVDTATSNLTSPQYYCLCQFPYTGSYGTAACNAPSNPCSPNPCPFLLSLSCSAEPDYSDYTCNCLLGFVGKSCTDLPSCSSSSCSNGGTCTDNLDGTFTCACLPYFHGSTCGDIDTCEYADPCINGTCSNGGSGLQIYPVCTCDPGYTGQFCDEMIDYCVLDKPCHFDSPCTPFFGGYECHCVPGSTGTDCEINIDDCVPYTAPDGTVYPNRCMTKDSGAVCVDKLNGFSCTCSSQWTMEYCDMNVVIRDVMLAIYGQVNEAILPMLEELMSSPAQISVLVPFMIGQYSAENRTALSWSAEDLFLWSTYEEYPLDFQKDFVMWNDAVLGNCFTFNHYETLINFTARSSGKEGGFEAIMRLRQDEYLPWLDTAAMMVFVHSQDENIFSESVRYNAQPKKESTLHVSLADYTRLNGKYGTCIKSSSEVKAYYYTGQYTTDGCLRSCYQDMLNETCGCMDPRYPMADDVVSCPVSQMDCIDNAVTVKGDPSTWESCVCPLPCSNQEFTIEWNTASFVTESAWCETGNITCQDSIDDYVLIKVILPTLRVKVYAERPAMDINRFIAYVGGLLGVLVGFSVVSFIEIAYLFLIVGKAYLFP